MKVVGSLAVCAAFWAIPAFSMVLLLLKCFSPRTRDLMYFSIVETIAAALVRIDLFHHTVVVFRPRTAYPIARWAGLSCGASC